MRSSNPKHTIAASTADVSSSPAVAPGRSAAVVSVPIHDIALEDLTFQYRLGFSSADLKPSLEHDGQMEPVDLFGARPYRIIDGFRRTLAIRELGGTSVIALLHNDITEDDAHRLAFLKNVARKNLSPIEKANAIRQACKRGRTAEQISEDFGLSRKQLHRYELLLTLSKALQDLVDAGEVPMAHAKALGDFRIVGELVEWVDRIGANKWSAPELRRALRAAGGQRVPKQIRQYIKRGRGVLRVFPFRVSKAGPPEELNAAIRALRDGLEFLEN